MRNRFAFQPLYFLFWLIFFVAAKAIFLCYYAAQTAALSSSIVAGIFGYGLRLDASAVAYLCLLPFFLLTAGSLLPRFPLNRALRVYTALMVLVVGVLTVVDLGVYRAWGFRLDSTPLQYLNSPAEMLASTGSAPVGLLLLVLGGLLGLGWALYRWVPGTLPPLPPGFARGRAALVGLLEMVLLIVPLRGGIQHIPVNQSDVYFSTVPFANHAAVNVPWNVTNALMLQEGSGENPYQFMPDTTAQRLVRQLYAPGPGTPDTTLTRLLRVPCPNVLFLIMESFTAKLVGCTGGEPGVTPNLDSLARTGVLFTDFYASGDRSQKGLVALLSGYPNQPATSIIKYPRKAEHLPHLCQSLKAAGYSSHYYHGGELAFANMKSYLVTAGYDQLTERGDFPPQEQNSKWGAHDHVLYARMLRELPSQRSPFFVTAFTLSSHEPFDIPIPAKFPGTDEAAQFRNSVYYADWALGRFLQAARTQPWWENTLLVVVADHGHHLPNNDANESPNKFRIPLVLAGGALRPAARGQVVTALGSQTDIAPTLLHQLGLPAQQYAWGRDLFRPVREPFAFYCFTDGFGMLTPRGSVLYDNVARREYSRDPTVTDQQLRQGQAYEQTSFADFLTR